ncbi:hypothetical protein FisN_12Lu003 [Fistulifera solaris]|uniref:Complex 1 LYR protein domain-containing protein n=1 Tax=Fistulifera solaris TaxID=1519565 RepID=A0A1Z5KHA8_FISSO|nr:hypothetical protein FisN_12Lu003 [Fistulifera solaris]|eukprot:GAX25462.1 hypothetical protein FisN_12Lu003 [Fistulifera solaris]
MSATSTQQSLLHLYRKLLRSCQTFPSRKRDSIHQAIREDFRFYQNEQDPHKIEQQISIAIKGLDQLQQFNVSRMTSTSSSSWNVHLEQNPMPKPDDYDERKQKKNTKK